MLSLFIVLILSGCAYAKTDDELKAAFTKIVLECTKYFKIDTKELMQMQLLIPPKSPDGKCLLACAYKADGSMDASGKYNIKRGYELAELSKNGDEKRLENGKKLADTCVKVNDLEVSDGDKGCDRAVMIFNCIVEHAPKLGFKL